MAEGHGCFNLSLSREWAGQGHSSLTERVLGKITAGEPCSISPVARTTELDTNTVEVRQGPSKVPQMVKEYSIPYFWDKCYPGPALTHKAKFTELQKCFHNLEIMGERHRHRADTVDDRLLA